MASRETPTVILPPAPPSTSAVRLANALRRLAADVANGRISDTDRTILECALKALQGA